MKTINVALILGPHGTDYESFYYDKFPINNKRPWLSNVPYKYHVSENGDYLSKYDKDTKRFVRIDIAVGYCLKYMMQSYIDKKYFKNVHPIVTLLPINKVSVKELNKYDMVINHFMDLLINPYMKKFEKDGKHHEKLRLIYKKHQDKIYPPIDYESLIYDKCDYYKYLNDKGFPIASTYCISRNEYETDKEHFVKQLTHFAIKNKWGKVFAKPVEGSDSLNIKLFETTLTLKSRKKVEEEIIEYMDNIFANKLKYPKIVFQKFMKHFEKTMPQIRMYYLGNKYQYSILNMLDGSTVRPKQNGDNNGLNFKYLTFLQTMSTNILRNIKKDFFKRHPMLITRIDYGCCLTNKGGKESNFFINEIEFNPGMYLHLHGDDRFNFDLKITKQLMKAIKSYSN